MLKTSHLDFWFDYTSYNQQCQCMCGISAVFKYNRVTDSDKERLHKMNKEMKYRGPDDEGVWSDERCGLAQTRLSIIGLDNGHQPMSNEDESLILVCNGEIYNYKVLIPELQSKGHVFRTNTDSEVIVHLYEEYGTACLQYLRGMFAFCMYDRKKDLLFCARDRIGEKTLYYAEVPCGVVFSTELKAIVKYYIDKPQVNVRNLAESIRYGYPIEQKNTYVEQIKRVLPGEYFVVDTQGVESHSYWNRYCLPKFEGTRDEAQHEVLRLMQESVANCLQSDVPVAVLLSGGIDSSAIAHFAKQTGKEIHCICAGYKGQNACDERAVAKKYASEKGLIYHEIELDASDYKSIFDEYPYYIDEPVSDIASIAQWAIYKKAKELGFKVLLGGLGGDELFYGYFIHNRLGQALNIHHRLESTTSRWDWLKTFLCNLRYFDPHRRMHLDERWPEEWIYYPYQPFAKTASYSVNGTCHRFKNIDVNYRFPYRAGIDSVYDLVFSRFMTMQCLYLADRLGMGNSMELRSPLVDYKLVEFVSSLPLNMKYTKDQPKQFLKDMLAGIVPDEILYAQKRGFTPPSSFIQSLCDTYTYHSFTGKYVFFNSMLADRVVSNVLNGKV